MKRDIFNTLKHSGHDLRIIKEKQDDKDVYLLGCVSCGETLYSTEDCEDKIDAIKEMTSAYHICMKEKAFDVANKLKELMMLKIDVKALAKYKIDDNKEYLKKHGYIYLTLCEKRSSMTKALEEVGIDFSEIIKEEMIKLFNNEEEYGIYKLLRKEEVVYISNKEIEGKCNNNYNPTVALIDMKTINRLESECPTVTDVKVINSKDDFFDMFPDYDDEEYEDPKFYEFTFRMKHNLIDFSRLSKEDKVEILYSSLEYFFDYDYVERQTVTINKMLSEFGINK